MFVLIRFAAQFAFAAALLAIGGLVSIYLLTPPPPSPPLVTAAGETLDAEATAEVIEAIFQSAREDDAAAIRDYLATGYSPNVRSPRGDTLLIVASYRDSRAVVAALLQAKQIELDARNQAGLTAVSAAAFKGHDEALKLLIAAGADVHATGSLGQSALTFATLAGNSSTVEILKQAGAGDAGRDKSASPTAD